jgi:DNA-binding cell septation regulator SpoVG
LPRKSFSLIGPPGAGKTTTLQIISLLNPNIHTLITDQLRPLISVEENLWNFIGKTSSQKRGPPTLIEHCGLRLKQLNHDIDNTFLLSTNINILEERINTRTINETPLTRSLELIATGECNQYLLKKAQRIKFLSNNHELELIKNARTLEKRIGEIIMSMFSNVKINFVNKKPGSKFLAAGSVDVAGVVQVNFSIIEGPRGRFVGLPGKYIEDKEKNKKWVSDARLLSRELQDELNRVVLAELTNHLTGQTSESQPETESSPDNYDF